MSMDSLLKTEFTPLAEAKAKLSALVRKIVGGKRLVITSHGRPQAVLLSFQDYLSLLPETPVSSKEPVGEIQFQNWRRGKPERKEVRASILKHFNPTTLPRKGQKDYKRKRVERFGKKSS